MCRVDVKDVHRADCAGLKQGLHSTLGSNLERKAVETRSLAGWVSLWGGRRVVVGESIQTNVAYM